MNGQDRPDGVDFNPDSGWFAERRPAFGTGVLALRVGPLRFALEGLSPRQRDRFLGQYRPFLEEKPAGPADLTVRLTHAGREAFLRVQDAGSEVYRMPTRLDGGARRWWSYEFAGSLAADRRTAELALALEEGPGFDRGSENFLRAMTAGFIQARGGMLLHGATVVRGGRAYVFFGPSGSGKTTVTHLSPRDLVLSDDLTLLVPAGDRFEAAGIPFGMAHHHVPDSNEAFPIAGLHRLVQSSEVRRERLSGAAAMADVVASLPFVLDGDSDPRPVMDNLGRLLAGTPVWRLHFRRDDAFWSVIEER
ncbi:MAG TPA: hypothetical protein VFQ07_16020 [Candidatus Polarisedimenticolia bacterium]|nr:hypothetical protein [Candidatus Polarisedimenticolia bacterium]